MKKIQLSTLLCGGALALSLAVPLPSIQAAQMAPPTNSMPAPDALASTQWELVSPNYAGLDKKPTLKFENGLLNASVGLNRISSAYSTNGKTLTSSLLISTRMAGPPALMAAETKYKQALENVRSFEISRDGKTLSLRGAQVLTFKRVGKTVNNPLAQTQWQLVSPGYAGLNQKPTLGFSDNRLNASVGLNQINGEYEVNDLGLKVLPLAATRMAGPAAVMSAETDYAKILQGSRSFELTRNGQTLTLRGDKTLKFERVRQTMNDPLAATQWNLTSPNYAGLQDRPTLRFDGGAVAASVGLNQMGGEYQVNGQNISFGNMFSTQMAGPTALMNAEQQYARTLAGIKSFEISRDGKILSLRGPQVLTFERAGQTQTMNNPLAATQWKLNTPNYAGVTEAPTLAFSDNRLNASAGLNQIQGAYSVSDEKITVSPLASTRMAGPPALMTAETQYSKALQSARSFEISGDGKTLTMRGDTTLTFSAEGQMTSDPLAMTEWELTSPKYAGAEKTPTLSFRDGSLGASVGLNGMGAGYKIDGNRITLEQFISTMMAGPPALMEAENAYKTALGGARTFAVSPDGQTLTLRGAQTLTFKSKGKIPQGFMATETKIINVEPQLGPEFDGDKTPKYLQLEDLSQGASWGRFTEAKILGFDFQPGNRYQLRVQVERDAQSGEKQLRLLEVFSQQYVATSPLGADEKIMEVAPTMVDCVGVMPMKCLQVREVGGQWQNFYSPIEGFDFVEGSRYRLQVKVTKIANPPADASNLRYQLVRVLDKMPVIY